jgi:pyrimidine-nucleoside phosphorylase
LDIQQFVDGVTDGSLSDVEVEAGLREIYDNGLSDAETVELTHAMLHSGTTLKWPKTWANLVVDKHSTGGVGDKVSIPLAPALAACGVKVPMISGRGLGFTGGTLDKLESIPGYTVALEADEILAQVDEIGCCIVGQTGNIAPADKRMYAIRDVTGLIASIPLVTGSILSKKAAAGLSALVMDVKVGGAAFMKTEAEARALAESMATTGGGLGMATSVTLTRMDAPIGFAIGNSLEILESVETLRGNGPADLEELVTVQGGILLAAAEVARDPDEGEAIVFNSLHDGSALAKFVEMCAAQGVDPAIFESENSLLTALGLLDQNLQTSQVLAQKSGYVSNIDALTLGVVAGELGAGRQEIDDVLDMQVGMVLDVQVGSQVEEGEPWITVYHRGNLDGEQSSRIENSLTISTSPVDQMIRIIDIL